MVLDKIWDGVDVEAEEEDEGRGQAENHAAGHRRPKLTHAHGSVFLGGEYKNELTH